MTQTHSIWFKLILSHSTWWCLPSWILPSWIQPFWTNKNTSLIHSDSTWRWWAILKSTNLGFSQLCTKKNFTHTFWLILMMAAILNSAILNSVILDSTILNNKKTSLIHCHPTWWWQPSWTLPCWIQPLPSWIQTPCYLLSDSLKNTITPPWLWLKLIQSDSNSFIFT